MTHPVLSDPDLSIPIVLRHHDGTATETTGIVSQLPESAAELRGALSEGGWQAWVARDRHFEDGEFSHLEARGRRWRVLALTNLSSVLGGSARLQLA